MAERQIRVNVGERALTVRRDMLPSGTWEVTATRSDAVPVEVPKPLHSLTDDALEQMIEVVSEFIRTEAK